MFGLQTPELLAIAIIALLLFGANKLPELGRAFGKTIKEFRKSFKEVDSETQQDNTENTK